MTSAHNKWAPCPMSLRPMAHPPFCRKATLECTQPWHQCREGEDLNWDVGYGSYQYDGYMDPPALNEDFETRSFPYLHIKSMMPWSLARIAAETDSTVITIV